MKWINSLLCDCDGGVSSKRVVTLLAFVICAWGFIASVVGYTVDAHLFDSMMYIVIAGLGFTASEKFTKKDSK